MCCLNVKELRLVCPDVDQPDEDMVAGIVTGLLFWNSSAPEQTLSVVRLDAGGFRMGNVFGMLGTMSGLHCLHISGLVAADLPGMLELDRCSLLTELCIETTREPLERRAIKIEALVSK